jgi:hypothetical protein
MSNKERGKPLRNERHRDIRDGLSVYETLEQAENQPNVFKRNPFVGVAILDIPDGVQVRFQRSGDTEGHHRLWAAPEELIVYVREVVQFPTS